MSINYEFDTITAIATPLGTGGVGVIRISGSKTFEIIGKIFTKPIEIEKINHGWIVEGSEKIDEVIVLAFKSPKSYTGENVVEIQCHGGLSILNNILELILNNGARIAEKGEFTKRAFLNKKLDLSQAEAVVDLIHSKTSKFAKKSANNLAGRLSTEISAIRDEIFELLSKIIAGIDFPEDVIEPEYTEIENVLQSQINKIENILASSKSSNILRQGVKVAITGSPNVGKSSLFNAMLNFNRAIVTNIAGTTRDAILETIDLGGLSVTFIDTAGIRDEKLACEVEKIGIDYSKEFVENADLVLFLFDLQTGMNENDKLIFEAIKHKKHIVVGTKSDLNNNTPNPNLVTISSINNSNIDLLKQRIRQTILDEDFIESDFITNYRQQDCLMKCKEALRMALNDTQIRQIQDLISIDIKSALMFLGEITGETISDDILNNIFENFCIGK